MAGIENIYTARLKNIFFMSLAAAGAMKTCSTGSCVKKSYQFDIVFNFIGC